MHKAAPIALLLATSIASAQNVLFDNGGFITHPGAGAGGADVSQMDDNFFGIGNVVAYSSPGDIYRGAEDFIVPAGETWLIERVRIFAFSQIPAGQPVPPSPFTDINMNIWDGDPRDGGSTIVATSTTLGNSIWTGIYRTEHGNLLQDIRPVYTAEAVFSEEELTAGTYWIDFQVGGGNAVTPYVKDGLLNANGNAMVLFSTSVGFAQTTYNGRGVAYPFIVEGTGPSTECYANCDGSTTEPILTVNDFTCFINEFAAAQSLAHEQQVEHYANCDGSTTAPVLTVNDFTCFINEFAAGCP